LSWEPKESSKRRIPFSKKLSIINVAILFEIRNKRRVEMKKTIYGILLLVFLIGVFPKNSRADVGININIGIGVGSPPPPTIYYGFLSYYYGIPESIVVDYENRLHSWVDVDTVFFLSSLTGCPASVIVNWRLAGMPWTVIVARLHVPPSAFYIPYRGDDDDYFEEHEGPPYGKAWGYWRHHALILNDDAIRNRVLLLTTSRYYHIPPGQEMKLLAERKATFASIIKEHGREHEDWGKFDRKEFEHGREIPRYAPLYPEKHEHKHEHGGPPWMRGDEEHGHGHGGHGHGHNHGDDGDN
jgi:hypothetical protein